MSHAVAHDGSLHEKYSSSLQCSTQLEEIAIVRATCDASFGCGQVGNGCVHRHGVAQVPPVSVADVTRTLWSQHKSVAMGARRCWLPARLGSQAPAPFRERNSML